MKNKAKKICFASSSGGHLEELLMLRPLMERYDSFIVTEKTAYEIAVPGIRCYYLQQVNRRERACMRRLIVNAFRSLKIFVIGVLATIPLCLLCRIFGKKLVYIESFANVRTPSQTGRLMYRFAHRFYVQWPEMQEYYPKAIYRGGVY